MASRPVTFSITALALAISAMAQTQSIVTHVMPDVGFLSGPVSVVGANPTATTYAWDCRQLASLSEVCSVMPTLTATFAPSTYVQTVTVPDIFSNETATGTKTPLVTATANCNIKGAHSATCDFTTIFPNKDIETETITYTASSDIGSQTFTVTAGLEKLASASATSTSTGTGKPSTPTGNSTSPQSGQPTQSDKPGTGAAIQPFKSLLAPGLLIALFMFLQ